MIQRSRKTWLRINKIYRSLNTLKNVFNFFFLESKKEKFNPEKKYKNLNLNQKLPKLLKFQNKSSFLEESTLDGSSRNINHDSIMQTIKDLKNHMSEI